MSDTTYAAIEEKGPLTQELLEKMNGWWRAANYLSAGQMYLLDNPLLKEPLRPEHVKKKIVGHWGTVPGQNFIFVHLNRVIRRYDLDLILVDGPGHGGNAFLANDYLDGSYSEVYPDISEDEIGMKKLFRQFSFPGGVPSHCSPETPGSINEGGELGYSVAHAFGAAFDNPGLIAAVIVGDGEAETAPLSASWQSSRFLNPVSDGAVLPILHLNGFKFSNPTIFARMPRQELVDYFHGCGWEPYFVEGDDPMTMHRLMAQTLDAVIERIREIQTNARDNNDPARPVWPMIVLRTPKGWTGPKVVDGRRIEGGYRSHQVPVDMTKPEHLQILSDWLTGYHPEELFTEGGQLRPELKALAPEGNHRIGLNPHANGGRLMHTLRLPDFRGYAFDTKGQHGGLDNQDIRSAGQFVRDIFRLNEKQRSFRIFSPDETGINHLNAVFEAENRSWNEEIEEGETQLAPSGRIMDSMLSEHLCEGWLEGYLLTGRHGFFLTYESFARIIDSMAAQHAKWLKVCNQLHWREPISSLNLVMCSTVWQQDQNGFTHQDPGFMDHIANKKADVVRIYLPPDTNCLLSTMDHCLRSKNYVNVIVASKHARPQWLSMQEAESLCSRGIGIWEWASNDRGMEPDIVFASAGDTPTLEALAAVSILKKELPQIRIRFVNVVDLFKLQPHSDHPHGLTDEEYDMIFTRDKPVIFNFHGYPGLIHELTYRRRNNRLIHVRGYKEEGTITTPFDMRVQNDIDRFHLVQLALRYLPQLGNKGAYLYQKMSDRLVAHRQYILENGQDLPEVADWRWKD